MGLSPPSFVPLPPSLPTTTDAFLVKQSSVFYFPAAYLHFTILPAPTSQTHDRIMASVASLLCPHQNRKVSLLHHVPNTSWIMAPELLAFLLTWRQRRRGPTNKCPVKQDIHPATPTYYLDLQINTPSPHPIHSSTSTSHPSDAA